MPSVGHAVQGKKNFLHFISSLLTLATFFFSIIFTYHELTVLFSLFYSFMDLGKFSLLLFPFFYHSMYLWFLFKSYHIIYLSEFFFMSHCGHIFGGWSEFSVVFVLLSHDKTFASALLS